MGMKTGLATVIAVLAMAAAGCGGDDEETTAEALTKEEFIAQADQICADGDAEINQAGEELTAGGQPSQSEVTEFISSTVIPNIQDQRDEIAALGAPEGDEEEINAILEGLDQAVAAAEADPAAATSNSAANPFTEVNQLAQDYGLTACGAG